MANLRTKLSSPPRLRERERWRRPCARSRLREPPRSRLRERERARRLRSRSRLRERERVRAGLWARELKVGDAPEDMWEEGASHGGGAAGWPWCAGTSPHARHNQLQSTRWPPGVASANSFRKRTHGGRAYHSECTRMRQLHRILVLYNKNKKHNNVHRYLRLLAGVRGLEGSLGLAGPLCEYSTRAAGKSVEEGKARSKTQSEPSPSLQAKSCLRPCLWPRLPTPSPALEVLQCTPARILAEDPRLRVSLKPCPRAPWQAPRGCCCPKV